MNRFRRTGLAMALALVTPGMTVAASPANKNGGTDQSNDVPAAKLK